MYFLSVRSHEKAGLKKSEGMSSGTLTVFQLWLLGPQIKIADATRMCDGSRKRKKGLTLNC